MDDNRIRNDTPHGIPWGVSLGKGRGAVGEQGRCFGTRSEWGKDLAANGVNPAIFAEHKV